jgi:hypothetical protein
MTNVKGHINEIVKIALEDLIKKVEAMNLSEADEEKVLETIRNYQINLTPKRQKKVIPDKDRCPKIKKNGERCNAIKRGKACWFHMTEAEQKEYSRTRSSAKAK